MYTITPLFYKQLCIFGINAFNYHFPEILNYSLWQTDSCFKVNNRLAYKEKEKYQNILERNSLASFSDTLYYKKTWSDTIFQFHRRVK